ncbi:MAG: secretion system protein [Thermoproteus sp.]
MSFAMRQLIAAAAALGVVAVAALAVYKAVVAERAVYPIVEAVEAVKALKPVQLPDYVPIYVLEVHYEEAEGRYVLMPGPSPPNCTSCIPPRGWLYSVSFGGNASPIYGVYYDAHNNTLWLGHVAVMPPYFDNGVLYYIYPACRGGYYLSERLFQSASTKPPVAVVLLSCS